MSTPLSTKRVTVIGGGGYVGTLLVQQLAAKGWDVVCFDTFWFGNNFHDANFSRNITVLEGDVRDKSAIKEAVKGSSHLIHLACISNDPSFELDPEFGKSVNLDSFEPLVEIAIDSGIQRFVYASSSSVYGVKSEERVTEDLTLEPLTDYSRFKAECESILLSKNKAGFETVILRPATICGVSARQRLDLVVNLLTFQALSQAKITVTGGPQFRPNLHIDDMCRAYHEVLTADATLVDGEIFNVGGDNLSVDEIASEIQRAIPSSTIERRPTNDLRSYRIDSTKILRSLGFAPEKGIRHAISDLIDSMDGQQMDVIGNDSRFFNMRRMTEILEKGKA